MTQLASLPKIPSCVRTRIATDCGLELDQQTRDRLMLIKNPIYAGDDQRLYELVIRSGCGVFVNGAINGLGYLRPVGVSIELLQRFDVPFAALLQKKSVTRSVVEHWRTYQVRRESLRGRY
jgi:hypothetical protein